MEEKVGQPLASLKNALNTTPKIILLDATGEYRSFDGPAITHVHLGVPTQQALTSVECSLPSTAFVKTDFIALFEPSGKSQGPKLRAAMKSLRLAMLVPTVATRGFILKINQPKAAVNAAERQQDVAPKLDDPQQAFDVEMLNAQIEQECVWPDGFGKEKNTKDKELSGGAESGDIAHCLSLMARISAVLSSPAFTCVFKSKSPSLHREDRQLFCR